MGEANWLRPRERRLLVAGSVCWIISGLDLREPLHVDGVDLSDPVLELRPFDILYDLAIPENLSRAEEK